MQHLTTSFLTLALAAGVCAQSTTVLPSSLAAAEGNSSTAWPFGLGSQCRIQYLYGADLIAVPAMSVTRLALRGNGGTATAGKSGVDVEIQMSATPASPWAASTAFAANHGPNVATPFTRKLVNLPAQPSTPTPAPFVAQFPLDTPFPYATAMGNLLIDYVVFAQPAGTYSHDTMFTIAAAHTAVGTACGATQAVTGGAATSATALLTYNLTGAPANGSGFHVLGTTSLPGVPLPFGGCLLHQTLDLMVPVTVSGTGTARVDYPLQYWYRGVTVHGQYVIADNPFTALSASQSHTSVIGGYLSHTRIYNNTSSTSASGTLQVGVGIVTELAY